MSSLPDEYKLALRARDGDREALSELVARTRMRLFAPAYAELRHYDDAQDAVAAALLRICRHIGRLQEPERVVAWMHRIVRNEARRLQRRRMLQASGSETAGVAGMSEDAQTLLLRLDIERALARLPGDQARALRLFHLEGQSIRAIAQRLGRSEGTVKSWLHRARPILAAAMEEYRPMEPLPNAVILQTDLSPDLRDTLRHALETAGYRVTIPAGGDMSRLLAQLKEGRFALLEKRLRDNELLILDETIGGRSALEILLCASGLLTEEIGLAGAPRFCLLSAGPWGSAAFAVWKEGVHLLVNKDDPAELAQLPESFRRLRRSARQTGRGYSAKAKRASNTSLAITAQVGKKGVSPNFLALVLLKDADLASYKTLQSLGADVEGMRQELLRRLGNPSVTPMLLRDFVEVANEVGVSATYNENLNRMRDFTYQEAWRSRLRYLSTAHLLMGILRLDDSLAGKLLAEHGVELDALRAACVPFAAEEEAESDAFYAAETEEVGNALWAALWPRAGEYVR